MGDEDRLPEPGEAPGSLDGSHPEGLVRWSDPPAMTPRVMGDPAKRARLDEAAILAGWQDEVITRMLEAGARHWGPPPTDARRALEEWSDSSHFRHIS